MSSIKMCTRFCEAERVFGKGDVAFCCQLGNDMRLLKTAGKFLDSHEEYKSTKLITGLYTHVSSYIRATLSFGCLRFVS